MPRVLPESPKDMVYMFGYNILDQLWSHYPDHSNGMHFLTILKLPRKDVAEKMYNRMDKIYDDTHFYQGVYPDLKDWEHFEDRSGGSVILAKGTVEKLELPEATFISGEQLLFPC
jgi:hypothetical protein